MGTNIVEVAVFGLGTMGLNLSLNILEKGFKVSAYDIKEEARKNFYNSSGINAYSDVKLLIKDISKPRTIWLMLPSGDCTDSQLNNLKSLLSSGDLIIDGGNSLFLDTIRRQGEFNELGIYFVGLGISGGYAGARNGPSLMVGGEKKAVEIIRPILNAISATANDGSNCVYESVSGAGHLIKTVHNGIEYAIMQLIAESYYVLRNLGKTDCKTISKIFSKWNNTNIGSYLLEITSLILAEDDDFSNQSLIDVIVDSADQNGTGSWSSIAALEFGIYSSIITESVNLRYLSELLDEREILSYRYATNIDQTPNLSNNSLDILTSDLYASLTNSIICAYAEGFSIIKKVSVDKGWNVDLAGVAKVWSGGCIIRSDLLKILEKGLVDNDNIFLNDEIVEIISSNLNGWRKTIIRSIENHIPSPIMSTSLSFFDCYSNPKLWFNLIQAQRDKFGNHGFDRIDGREDKHHNWR